MAAFIATMRAICSLTAASVKHWKMRTRTLAGSSSSSSACGSGENSYSRPAAPAAASSPVWVDSGRMRSTTARCRAVETNFV